MASVKMANIQLKKRKQRNALWSAGAGLAIAFIFSPESNLNLIAFPITGYIIGWILAT